MMDTRAIKAVAFRTKSKFNWHDAMLTKEQSIGSKIVKAFPNQKLNNRTVFFKQKNWFLSFKT